MAFIPVVNNSTGNLQIGESNKTLTMVGSTPFLATAAWQTYSITQTFSGFTRYTLVPSNFLTAYVPYLVVGKLFLNSAPWYVIYTFMWANLQQNGDSRSSNEFIAFRHNGNASYVALGNITSFYANGVAPFRAEIYYSFTSYGTWSHEFYRLGT